MPRESTRGSGVGGAEKVVWGHKPTIRCAESARHDIFQNVSRQRSQSRDHIHPVVRSCHRKAGAIESFSNDIYNIGRCGAPPNTQETYHCKTGAARLNPKDLYETIDLKLFYICIYPN